MAVYVHWPFCLAKCPYCDFNSHVRTQIDEDGWCRALIDEIDFFALQTPGRTVTSVFFGGGTPSLMAPASVAAVIDRIATAWSLGDDAEISLEANPTSAERRRFEGYRKSGVNRLSLGVQALDENDLKRLGRGHDVTEARAAVAAAQAVFPRGSFDLIYARPGQTHTAWRRELKQAVAMADGHLSAYQLTLEKGTPFFSAAKAGTLVLPGEDSQAALFETTQEVLDEAGLRAYEVSNHARPGEACRHNLTYWRSGDYIGIGPGAHGRLTSSNGIRALCQIRAPEKWRTAVETDGNGIDEDYVLDSSVRAREVLMMGLRLTEGISAVRFAALTGYPLDSALAPDRTTALAKYGLIAWDNDGLRVTAKGRPVLNAILAEILI